MNARSRRNFVNSMMAATAPAMRGRADCGSVAGPAGRRSGAGPWPTGRHAASAASAAAGIAWISGTGIQSSQIPTRGTSKTTRG